MVNPGGDETTAEALAQVVAERYLPNARLFGQGEDYTDLGILWEPGIIAMDGSPTRAAALDYAARWAIGPTFADFKGLGVELEDSHLEQADRSPGKTDPDHGLGHALVCTNGSE